MSKLLVPVTNRMRTGCPGFRSYRLCMWPLLHRGRLLCHDQTLVDSINIKRQFTSLTLAATFVQQGTGQFFWHLVLIFAASVFYFFLHSTLGGMKFYSSCDIAVVKPRSIFFSMKLYKCVSVLGHNSGFVTKYFHK